MDWTNPRKMKTGYIFDPEFGCFALQITVVLICVALVGFYFSKL